MPTTILGISAFYHDSAAALITDGQIIAAAQEERFTRVKHDAGFPAHALRFCLDEAGIELDDVEYVVFYEKPFVKFERLLETYLAFSPRGFNSFRLAMPLWLREKLFQKRLLLKELERCGAGRLRDRLLFAEHHLSHAASAYYPSGFDNAAIVTADGVGEWATTSIAHGRGNKITTLKEISFPHSLGLLYSAFTYFTGFRVNSGEYKLMGLAPYGDAKYARAIRDHLIDIRADGSFRLNLDYFDYCTGLRMTNERFDALFGAPPRTPEAPIRQLDMDLASSIQAVLEDVLIAMVQFAVRETGCRDLCLAGGVALNCVANGKLLKAGVCDQIWVQPAAGDAGGALGAAFAAYHSFLDQPYAPGADAMAGSFLGPAFSQAEIERRLRAAGAAFDVVPDEDLVNRAADDLANGKALGWFQGRMEFGPRALGNRSILADPRVTDMQRTLNLKVKFRESFRPFAPSVLLEQANQWFDLAVPSPYMMLVADVLPSRRSVASTDLQGLGRVNAVRSEIPSVTHVDYSARVQTVDSAEHPLYHRLLSAFYDRTGCPVLINTSFNVRGEPIVCTPEDAYRCFTGTGLDVLYVGRCRVLKDRQGAPTSDSYAATFALD